MNAEFTPTQNEYKDLGQFRFWCQKVLPLVYDDSLSYYELLCKVVNYINETIENMSLMGEDITALHNAYVELEKYVNTYFDNLDVEAEINDKLNLMASDGTLSALLNPIVRSTSIPLFVASVSAMTDTSRVYVLSSNGHLYFYNGVWNDSGLIYGQTDNVYRPSGVVLHAGALGDITNANQLVNGITYFILSTVTSDMIANLPVYSRSMCITTFNYSETNTHGKYQICVNELSDMYCRFEQGSGDISTWTDWKLVTNTDNFCSATSEEFSLSYDDTNKVITLKPAYYAIFFSTKTFYTIQTELTVDYPTEEGSYTCMIVLSNNTTLKLVRLGMKLDVLDMVIGYVWFSNAKNVRWISVTGDNEKAIKKLQSDIAPLKSANSKELLGAFASVGVVGDSLSVGYMTNTKTGVISQRNLTYSWAQFLAKKYGNKFVNFGQSGATCKSWTTHENCYPLAAQTANYCQGYIIGIGTNDNITAGGTYSGGLGTIADVNVSDYNSNADTFYGYYAGIIQRLKELVPDCIVFCMTIPYPRENAEKNNAIREICNLLADSNVLLVDLAGEYNDLYKSEEITQFYYAGHFTAVGYKAVADLTDYCVSDVMSKNADVVQDIGFIYTTS